MENLKNKTDMDKLSWNSLIARIKSETPPFWKNLRKWMVGCGVIGAALAAIPDEHLMWIPEKFRHVPSILLTLGAIGTALSSLAVTTPNPAAQEPSPENPN
jgi:hypothetical protein